MPSAPTSLPDEVRDSVFVLGAEKSTGTPELLDNLPIVAGIEPRRIDNYIIESMSDYDAFMNAGIPFLFYTMGRSEHYHAPTDTPDRLDYDKMSAFATHLTDLVTALADRPDTPKFDPAGFDDAATVATIRELLDALVPYAPASRDGTADRRWPRATAQGRRHPCRSRTPDDRHAGDATGIEPGMRIKGRTRIEEAPVSARNDRIAGVLVGLAAGDALGAGYEFGPAFDGPVEMKGGGPFGWEPGEWTDDTQMAICIAEQAATGDLDLNAIGDRFIAWSQEATDIGNQTRAVLSQAILGADLPAVAAARFHQRPRHSAGNGSLMRTGPVALPFLGDNDRIAEAAAAVSALTHADPLAIDACVLWSIAVGEAVETGELPGDPDRS